MRRGLPELFGLSVPKYRSMMGERPISYFEMGVNVAG